jgi:large subunit ribosomal protein L37Ae
MPTKRFGPRYGRKPKNKLAKVEALQKAKQKCPHCNKLGVKRLATGIYNCPKCDTKFAGKAYII